MPIFIDLHIGQGMTAEIIAVAHQRDLANQDNFKCQCLTYWLDEARGNSYCLIKAPDKEAVRMMHWAAHEQFPDEIVEVDERIVKAFLGRLHDPEVVDYMIDQKIKVFNDPAFRVLLAVEMKDKMQLSTELEAKKGNRVLEKSYNIIQNAISSHQGVAAEKKNEELIGSFDAALPAILCAIDIKNHIGTQSKTIDLRMSVHAGNPIDNHPELFGNTLMLSRFLNMIPKRSSIVVSNIVKSLLEKASKNFLARSSGVQSISAGDEEFLKKLALVFSSNWQNSNFDVQKCTKAMSLSKSKLYRQCVGLTGMSTARLLMEFRLRKARQLLQTSNRNISQTAFDSGFNSASYFSKCFHKRFSLQPTTYLIGQ